MAWFACLMGTTKSVLNSYNTVNMQYNTRKDYVGFKNLSNFETYFSA